MIPTYRTRADERAACIHGASSKQGPASLGDHRQFTLSTPLDGNGCIGSRDTLDALAVGRASRTTDESRLNALTSFQAIDASKQCQIHIDDCVLLNG